MESELKPIQISCFASQGGSDYYNAQPTFMLGGDFNVGFAILGAVLTFEVPLTALEVVDSANLILSIANSTGVVIVDVYVELGTNVQHPTNLSECLTQMANGTVAKHSWPIPNSGTQYTTFTSIDLSASIQEQLLNTGWDSNDKMNLFLVVTNPTLGETVRQTIFGLDYWDYGPYDETENAEPLLTINHHTGTDPGLGDRHVEHILSFTNLIFVRGNCYNVESVLNINHDILVDRSWGRNFEHEFFFTQNVSDADRLVELQQTISFLTTSVFAIVQTHNVEHTLKFVQTPYRNTGKNKQVESEITITTDNINKSTAYTVSVESTMSIVSTPTPRTKDLHIDSGIFFQQEYTYDGDFQNNNLIHTLLITQEYNYTIKRVMCVEHRLTISQGALILGGKVTSGHTVVCSEESSYAPRTFEVEFTPFEELIYVKELSLVDLDTLDVLLLPRPLLTDREELEVHRIGRKTIDGDSKIFIDPLWGRKRIFRYKFEGLTSDKIDEIFVFFSNTLGKRLEMLDHESKIYTGFISNAQGESGEFLRFCGKTTEFDFELEAPI